jgi:hypothetical protein
VDGVREEEVVLTVVGYTLEAVNILEDVNEGDARDCNCDKDGYLARECCLSI